jgi:hypothetical protein
MKKIILAFLALASIASQASVVFNGSQGAIYTGTDAITGKACNVSIILVGKVRADRMAVAIRVRRDDFSIDSIVMDLDIPHTLRGGMRSSSAENLYSNLFLNEKTGVPESYDLADFNSERVIISCQNLRKTGQQ